MKKLLLIAVLALNASAQQGTMAGVHQAVTVSVESSNYRSIGIQLTGTWSGTIQFEGSQDCSTWVSVTAYALPGATSGVTSTTANGNWVASAAGLCKFRARISAYTSGSVYAAYALSAADLSTSGDSVSFTNSRTEGGCPIFPDNNIFNKDVYDVPVNKFQTQNILGGSWPVTGASYSGGSCTLTLASDSGKATPTSGLAIGSKIFVIDVGGGYNSSYNATYNTHGYGANNWNTYSIPEDPRVTVTAITSTTVSYTCTDPGVSWSGAGWVGLGPYGGRDIRTDPEYHLNLVTDATPTTTMYYDGWFRTMYSPGDAYYDATYPYAWSANSGGADNVPYPIQNTDYSQGHQVAGVYPTIATGPYFPENDGRAMWINTDTCRYYEVGSIAHAGPPFAAGTGAYWDLRSNAMRTSRLDTQDTFGLTSTSAAGEPRWPVTLKRSQMYGVTPDPITNPIAVTFPVTLSQHDWPATHHASHQTFGAYPPMGAWARLKSSFDGTTCQRGPNAGLPFPDGSTGSGINPKYLVDKLKHHGLVNVDNGLPWLLQMENTFDATDEAEAVGWTRCMIGDDFEFIDVVALQKNATSYEVNTYAPETQADHVYVTVGSTPSSLTMTVDGVSCKSPCSFWWVSGSSHTLTAGTPAGSTGVQYAFSSWSDGGATTHTVTPTQYQTYMATYTTQYYLTTASSTGGSISPASGWYNSGTVVAVSATPSGSSQFVSFSGDLTGSTTPQNVTMSAAKSVTALFMDPTNWSNYKTLTVNHTQVSSDQTNFPVLVSITDSDLQSIASTSGADIVFVAESGGALLPYYIESWDKTTGVLVAWVNIPSLSSTVDYQIRMYFGNASPPALSSQTAVWPSDYKLVSFLSAPGGTFSVADQTSNGNNGTNSGATATTGKIDGGAAVSGSTSFSFPNITALNGASAMTVSVWVKPTSLVNNGGIIQRWSAGGFYLEMTGTSGAATFGLTSSSNGAAPTGTLTAGSWTKLDYVYDGTQGTATNRLKAYKDGSAITLTNTGTYPTTLSTVTATVQAAFLDSARMTGSLDHIRISTAAKTAGWILTEYNNQNAPGSFMSVGPLH